MKKILAALAVVCLLVLPAAALAARPENPPGIDAYDVAAAHLAHGHEQRSLGGPASHTWRSYQREAAQLRAYLTAVAIGRRRADAVRRWSGVAACESGGNWAINTGNGYYGGLQFSLSTWRGQGGQGYPHQQPAWYQAEVADRLRVSSGLHHWPVCGSRYHS